MSTLIRRRPDSVLGQHFVKPKLAKKHLARLERMLANLDRREAELQARHGDVWPGSTRASDNLDAGCLRAVLALMAGGDA